MSNLYGLQTECKVDPNVLTGTGHSEGNVFTSSNSFIVDAGYQSDGKWSLAGSLLNPAPAFNGAGTAFSLNYKVMNAGHTTVECAVLAVDVNGNVLPIAVVNGSFDGTQAPAALPYQPSRSKYDLRCWSFAQRNRLEQTPSLRPCRAK